MTSLSSDQSGNQVTKDKMQMLINKFSSLSDDGLYFGIENQNDTHEASSNEEDEEGLADRFANIDLEDDSEENTQRILSLLTDQERRQFDQLLSSGNIGYLIPKKDIWIPWWMKWKSKLVTEIDADENSVKDTSSAKTELPKGLTQEEIHFLNKIPCLMSTSKPPSPCLPYNILNVVLSYCFVCRYFNGCHLKNWDESIDELTQVSPVIADGSVSYPDCSLAIHSSLCILMQEKKTPSSFIDVLLGDSLTIFKLKKEGLLKVFLEIKKMLLLVLQDTEKNDDGFSRKKYKLLLKRIEYYLSFCRDEVMLEQSMSNILLE